MAWPLACWPGSARFRAFTPTCSARSAARFSPARPSWPFRPPAPWPSSSLMSRRSTRGMSPARALFTLSVLTGLVMLAAGFFRLGSMLRFVPNTVMVGFISAVGVNIILGQLANLTGYKATGPTVSSAPSIRPAPRPTPPASLLIGNLTVALIVLLERTRSARWGWWPLSSSRRLASLSLAQAAWRPSAAWVPSPARCRCPRPRVLRLVPVTAGPGPVAGVRRAWSRGQSISANFPNPGGRYPEPPVTSSGRAPRTSSPGSSGGCRWAGPCPPLR